MSAPDAATVAAREVWALLARLDPHDVADTLASITVVWIDAASGQDPRARHAVFEAFTGAVADGQQQRDAMVAGHE